jgi:hypothetical protein
MDFVTASICYVLFDDYSCGPSLLKVNANSAVRDVNRQLIFYDLEFRLGGLASDRQIY